MGSAGEVSSAREVALTKPIIVIKAGRTEAAASVASSHTGALAESGDVFDAALRRCGALRVQTFSDFVVTWLRSSARRKQPRPRGERFKNLKAFLPPPWSHANLFDILGEDDAGRYAKTMEIALADPLSDGLLAARGGIRFFRMTEPVTKIAAIPRLVNP